jgi:hypothetical protein
VEKIYACKNDYILYRETEYEDLQKCPICGLVRFNSRNGGDDENCNRRKRRSKKGVLIVSYHFSFEVLVYKQKGIRIIVMAKRKA